MVAALDQNQAMQVRFGRQLEAAAIGFTYVVGIGSIGCIVLLFVLFWWTLLQEDTEGPEAIRREQMAAAKAKALARNQQRRQSQTHGQGQGYEVGDRPTERAEYNQGGHLQQTGKKHESRQLRSVTSAAYRRRSLVVPQGTKSGAAYARQV